MNMAINMGEAIRVTDNSLQSEMVSKFNEAEERNEQLGEITIARARLVEVGMESPERLLDHRTPDRIIVLRKIFEDLEHQIDRIRFVL